MLFSNAYVSYLGIRFCTGAASSTPTSSGSAKKARRSTGGIDGGEESPATIIATPQPRVKRSDTAESVPKLSREVQNRELKRSPTMHYSPEKTKPEKKGKVKKTAVKAKAKSVSKPAPTAASPKMESPPPATATAVANALTRKSTDELSKVATPSSSHARPSPVSPASASASDGEGSDEEDQVPDGDDEGERTLEQVRARKAAHARYMRFSRSLKSRRFLLYMLWVMFYNNMCIKLYNIHTWVAMIDDVPFRTGVHLILGLVILAPAQVAQRRSKQLVKLHTDATGFTKTSFPTNLDICRF